MIREIQTKATRKYHLTPTRSATSKNTERDKCCQGCGETGTLCPAGGNVKWCSCHVKQEWFFNITKHRTTVWPGFHLWVYTVHPGYISVTHNSQRVKATQVLISG